MMLVMMVFQFCCLLLALFVFHINDDGRDNNDDNGDN